MTVFEFVTQSPDHLASFVYGLLDQTESDIIDRIYLATGMEISRVSLAEEIRVAQIRHDLMEEYHGDT